MIRPSCMHVFSPTPLIFPEEDSRKYISLFVMPSEENRLQIWKR